MKFTSMILGSMVLAQATIAAPIFCNGSDWSVVTNDNLTTATVSHNNETVQFGDLKCRSGRSSTLVCQSEGVADAGYSFSVKLAAPGVDMQGSLSEETFAGARKVADLKCVGAANRPVFEETDLN